MFPRYILVKWSLISKIAQEGFLSTDFPLFLHVYNSSSGLAIWWTHWLDIKCFVHTRFSSFLKVLLHSWEKLKSLTSALYFKYQARGKFEVWSRWASYVSIPVNLLITFSLICFSTPSLHHFCFLNCVFL